MVWCTCQDSWKSVRWNVIGRRHTDTLIWIGNWLTNLLHGAEPFLRNRHLCSYSRTSQHFMDPEDSLPCSQVPSTLPYPDPDWFSSIPPHPISLRSILIISIHLCLGRPSCLFHSGFPTNILYAFIFSPIRATYSAHLILLDLIILDMERKLIENVPTFRALVRFAPHPKLW
jgi:hypothetical protein